MNWPAASRRYKTILITRRAAIGRALLARDDVSAHPDFLSLTEEERRNALALFAVEEIATREQHQTFERVPGEALPLVPPRIRRDAMPRVREARSALLWDVPLLVGALFAVCVVFAVRSTPLVEPTPTPNAARPAPMARAAVRPEAPRDVANASVITGVSNVAVGGTEDPEPGPARVEAAVARDVRRVPKPAVASPAAVEPVRNPEPATEPPLLEGLALPVSVSFAPRPVAAAPVSSPRAESAVLVPPPLPSPEPAIQAVLGKYRAAYQGLDVRAARAVWPSVDGKALSKAFERLAEQQLVFDSCDIAVSSGARALASCRGSVSYVPRVGKARRADQREWEFALTKVDDAWLIDSVSAR
jgi:hypothetical protein